MRFFATGASGFIGGPSAASLARDHDVLATSRSKKSDQRVRELGERGIPAAIARPAARLIEGTCRLFGLSSTPPLTRHAIDLMCCDCTPGIEKIRNELGDKPVVSVNEGLHQPATNENRTTS